MVCYDALMIAILVSGWWLWVVSSGEDRVEVGWQIHRCCWSANVDDDCFLLMWLTATSRRFWLTGVRTGDVGRYSIAKLESEFTGIVTGKNFRVFQRTDDDQTQKDFTPYRLYWFLFENKATN
jgi:hypothetical protein